jgi:hypothetical protein
VRRKCFVRSNPSRQREGDKVRRPAARIRHGCVLHGKKKYREQTTTILYTRKRTNQLRARWRRRFFVAGRAVHIQAVIMPYEEHRREAFLRDNCQWGR